MHTPMFNDDYPRGIWVRGKPKLGTPVRNARGQIIGTITRLYRDEHGIKLVDLDNQVSYERSDSRKTAFKQIAW